MMSKNLGDSEVRLDPADSDLADSDSEPSSAADLLDGEAEEGLDDSGFESEGDSMDESDSMSGSQAEDSQHSSDITDSESEPQSLLLGSSARRSGRSAAADSQAVDNITSSAQREEEDHASHTELHRAAEVGDSETVQKLLQSGVVDVNAQLPHSLSTPLHLACKAGHADVAQLLVDAGADVNAATGEGVLPVHEAAAWGHTECVALLLTHPDVKPDAAAGPYQNTVLHIAAINGHMGVLDYLLAEFLEFDTDRLNFWALNAAGKDALELAVREGETEAVRCLLSHMDQLKSSAQVDGEFDSIMYDNLLGDIEDSVTAAAYAAVKYRKTPLLPLLLRADGPHMDHMGLYAEAREKEIEEDYVMAMGQAWAESMAERPLDKAWDGFKRAAQLQREEMQGLKSGVQQLIIAAAGVVKAALTHQQQGPGHQQEGQQQGPGHAQEGQQKRRQQQEGQQQGRQQGSARMRGTSPDTAAKIVQDDRGPQSTLGNRKHRQRKQHLEQGGNSRKGEQSVGNAAAAACGQHRATQQQNRHDQQCKAEGIKAAVGHQQAAEHQQAAADHSVGPAAVTPCSAGGGDGDAAGSGHAGSSKRQKRTQQQQDGDASPTAAVPAASPVVVREQGSSKKHRHKHQQPPVGLSEPQSVGEGPEAAHTLSAVAAAIAAGRDSKADCSSKKQRRQQEQQQCQQPLEQQRAERQQPEQMHHTAANTSQPAAPAPAVTAPLAAAAAGGESPASKRQKRKLKKLMQEQQAATLTTAAAPAAPAAPAPAARPDHAPVSPAADADADASAGDMHAHGSGRKRKHKKRALLQTLAPTAVHRVAYSPAVDAENAVHGIPPHDAGAGSGQKQHKKHKKRKHSHQQGSAHEQGSMPEGDEAAAVAACSDVHPDSNRKKHKKRKRTQSGGLPTSEIAAAAAAADVQAHRVAEDASVSASATAVAAALLAGGGGVGGNNSKQRKKHRRSVDKHL